MIIKKAAINKALIISLLSLAVGGCIFEEQGIFAKDKKTNDAAVVEIVAFGYQQRQNHTVDYIERADIKITAERTQTTVKSLFGNDNTDNNKNNTNYLLADKVTVATASNIRKVADTFIDSALSYHLLWKDKESGSVLRHDIDYQAVDISGKSGVGEAAATGFSTVLDQLPATQTQGLVFPEGAICYVPRTKIDKTSTKFSTDKLTDYSTLMAWQGDQPFSSEMAQLSFGTTNDIAVSYIANDLIIDAESGLKSYRGAVQFDGKVYDAVVIPKQESQLNTDISKGRVDCQNYNEVAADFIEGEIKKVY